MSNKEQKTTMQPGEARVPEDSSVSRREFLRIAGLAGATIGVGGGFGGLVAGCGGEESTTTTAGATTTTAGVTTTSAAATATSVSAGPEMGAELKIGFNSSKTGPYAPFGVANDYCVERWREFIGEGVVCGDGKQHPISIIPRDNQSDSNRAAQIAGDLINNDKVDIVANNGPPELSVPVADACEASGVPCVSNNTPWQPWFFGRNGDPKVGFKWTYHMFWGLEDIQANFLDIWTQIPTNKVVGGMWPNDADGNAWRPAWLQKFGELQGWTVVDAGAYQNGTEDFTSVISQFKKAGVEIVTGVMIPPDFTNFFKQSIQQGLKYKICTVGKALLFPSSMEAIGDIGINVTSELWWHPTYPFKSSLTGETGQELADDFEKRTGNQWTQPIMHYAIGEVIIDALKRTANVGDKESFIESVRTTKLDTLSGHIDFTSPVDMATLHPVPNVYKTPQCSGQWVKGAKWPYEIVVVGNAAGPGITIQQKVQPMA